MQLSLTDYSLGVTISFRKFWFENDTLIQVRCCHLFGIWYVFIVDMLFSSFFDSAGPTLEETMRFFINTKILPIKFVLFVQGYSIFLIENVSTFLIESVSIFLIESV